MLYLKDGVVLLTFQENTPITHDGFLNPLQQQLAAALDCTKWLDIPLTGGAHIGTAASPALWPKDATGTADWQYGLQDRGDGTKVCHWQINAADQERLRIDLAGHPDFRPGCKILSIRTKTGGSVNGGDCSLIAQNVWTGNGSQPAAGSSLEDVFSVTDNKFNGTGLETVHAINETVLAGYRYSIQFTSAVLGYSRVFGVQALVEFPTS